MTTTLAQPRLRVLLADVDHDFFTKIMLLLDEIAPRRFVLEWASTYGFGVTVMRRQRFDLCLISSHIGHRSGTDLAIHIKANYPATPVIMLACGEELAETPAGQPVDCLDRNRLSVEMLRQALRDAVFRSTGGLALIPALAKPPASEHVRAAAA
jgi:DNA-binding NarL/FixJ family response regulator